MGYLNKACSSIIFAQLTRAVKNNENPQIQTQSVMTLLSVQLVQFNR
jgi:hypothetical protein